MKDREGDMGKEREEVRTDRLFGEERNWRKRED